MNRRPPPITAKPQVRRRYRLAQMLKGMTSGDMPAPPGWDGERSKGREAW